MIEFSTHRTGVLTTISVSCHDETKWPGVADALSGYGRWTSKTFSQCGGFTEIACSKRDAASICAKLDALARPAQAVPQRQSQTRILVRPDQAAPRHLELAGGRRVEFNGFGREFVCTESTHERNGCGQPWLIGQPVRYAYYA